VQFLFPERKTLNESYTVVILIDDADLDDGPYPTDKAAEEATEYGN